MSNMYFVTSDSLSDFMEVRYIIWAGNIEDLVLPGTWTISAGQKKLKSECPHMPESIKTLWEDPDDSNYVILPDMTGRFCMMETNPQNVGILHDAQAPNTSGFFDLRWGTNLGYSGVFQISYGADDTQVPQTENKDHVARFTFSQSYSSSIYVDQGTVRPNCISILVLIRI